MRLETCLAELCCHIFQPVSLLDMVHDGSCFIGSPFFKINFSKLNMFIWLFDLQQQFAIFVKKNDTCKQVSANLILCIQSIEVINTA